jgi:hypothetical protein
MVAFIVVSVVVAAALWMFWASVIWNWGRDKIEPATWVYVPGNDYSVIPRHLRPGVFRYDQPQDQTSGGAEDAADLKPSGDRKTQVG